jgi:large subunit ribosomal protein L21
VYAIVAIQGFQYRVSENDLVRVPRLEGEAGASVSLEQVYYLSDGARARVGQPLVPGARVEARIESHGLARKVIVGKFRRRKAYRRKNGHRQPFTEIRITRVGGEF